MNVLKNKMQRRDFLRSIARLGLTTAFTSQFMLSVNVFAQTAGAKRFVMVYYPNGCVRDKWHSYNAGALGSNSFATSPLQHLNAHLTRLVPIKNLTYNGHGGSSGHPEACRAVFSGGQEYATTFDVAIGEALGGRLTKNMHVGVWSSKAKGTEYMPFTDKNRNKIQVSDNPQQVYDALLADVVGSSSGTPDPDAARRKKVLETLHENLDLLQANTLSVKQQGKLLTHEEALNYYQNTLAGTLDIGGSNFSRPTIGMTGIDADADAIAKAQMRNIAMAFQANITRTASFQFMGAQDESLKINFPAIRPYMGEYGSGAKLDYNETRSHVSSHNESSLFDAQTRWYNIMVAYLMDELAGRPDLTYGGTLLDNTLILVMSEVGGGNHQQENPGIYVAGGAGNAVRVGNAIDANNAGMSNLYLDISKAFGLNWGRYGNSSGGIAGFLR
ncbi:DUF1552 domain-containing protein [Cellvibrio mixtus]|uniref:DUF1552 domain-containing protein n=1 Tax=Cellvibrio mixtus TaxID=39650 RepID=UPI000587514D|nr:DUF1552 domain-containing protein [Cellvibrio mixtus]